MHGSRSLRPAHSLFAAHAAHSLGIRILFELGKRAPHRAVPALSWDSSRRLRPEQTVAYLEKHELVKCSVLDGSSLSAREAAEELAERCHAEVVQVIGRKFSLYRESSRKDIEKIKLV